MNLSDNPGNAAGDQTRVQRAVPPSEPPGRPTGVAPSPDAGASLPKTIVDVHAHVWESPEQLGADAAAVLRRRDVAPWERADASVDALDRAMSTVQRAVLLGFQSQFLGASISHEQVAACVAHDPGKYIGFAGIDPMDRGFLASVDRAVELGLKGVVISPAAQNFHPSHTRAMKLYSRCDELGLPVLVHLGTHFGTAAVLGYSQPHLYDEPARSFPGLRFVIAQLGHPWIDPALVLLSKHQNVYADLSDLTRRPWQLYNALLLAYQQGVMGQLLFGSDFPFMTPEQAIVAIYSINSFAQGTSLPSIPREQLRQIVEHNALESLGIEPPAGEPLKESKGGPGDAAAKPTETQPVESSG